MSYAYTGRIDSSQLARLMLDASEELTEAARLAFDIDYPLSVRVEAFRVLSEAVDKAMAAGRRLH